MHNIHTAHRRGARVHALLAALALLTSPVLLRAQTSPKYNVIELPGAIDGGKVATALNNLGDVVGRAGGSLGSNTLAVRWSRDRHLPSHLSSLFAGEYSSASAISDEGDVVGASNTATALAPLIWQTGRGIQRIPLLRGDTSGQAIGINRQGQVVGYSSGPAGIRGFVWTRSAGIRELPAPAGARASRPRRVNDAGQIAGYSVTSTGKHATLWTGTGSVRDLGTLPGDRVSEATGLNNAGNVVGWSKGDKSLRGFIWTETNGLEDLGLLPGANSTRALDINDSDTVVGASTNPAGDRAFVWTRAGGMTDLTTVIAPSLQVTLIEAHAINSRGQILASGMDTAVNADGDRMCAPAPPAMFLLTPTP